MSTCYVHLQCDYGTRSICLDWTDICNGQINCLNDGIDEKDCWQLEVNQCNDHEYRCTNGICIPNIFYNNQTHTSDCLDASDYFYALRSLLFRISMSGLMYNTQQLVSLNTTSMIFYPNFPVLFGNIYLAYKKIDASYWNTVSPEFVHMCYQTSDYDSFLMNIEKISFGSTICVPIQQIIPIKSCTFYSSRQSLHDCILVDLKSLLKQYHRPYKYNSEICHRTQVYQCMNSSKCISI